MREPADRGTVEDVISDMISDFLYYDRKEDEQLPRGAIEQMVKDGEITVDQMVEMFRKFLTKGLGG